MKQDMHNKSQINLLRLSLVLPLCLLGSILFAQQPATEEGKVRSKRFRVYEYKGETYLYGQLDDIDITAKSPNMWQRRRGNRRLERYTRLQWNVHKVYPYALKVADVLREVDAAMAQMETEAEREAYLKERESGLFGEYEDDVRKMSRTQGKVLVKLIHRQTGLSAYDLIRNNKSSAAAVFWQGISRIFGINLKADYDQEAEEMIEDIVKGLETGGYNIYYKRYNYRLS